MRVAVVCGGPSQEAAVSRASAAEVAGALRERFRSVTVVEYGPDLLDRLREEQVEVVFPVMHGPPGEDGTLQGFLETIRMPYVGSGVLASACAMDKAVAKTIFRSAGLPVARSVVVRAGRDDPSLLSEARALGSPVVLKPLDQGSALGVELCHDVDRLGEALSSVSEHAGDVLVEEFVSGREVTVGVIEDADGTRALPVLEVLTPEGSWYDYDHRYTAGLSEHLVPAPLDDQVTTRLQELAVRAHRALGCRDLSRSDFVLPDDGRPVLLETNTLPGMTATSLYPDEARAAGIPFTDLLAGFVLRAHARGAGR